MIRANQNVTVIQFRFPSHIKWDLRNILIKHYIEEHSISRIFIILLQINDILKEEQPQTEYNFSVNLYFKCKIASNICVIIFGEH